MEGRGEGKFGMMQDNPKRADMPASLLHVGGMRDPHKAVLGLPTVQSLGQKIWKAWEAFVARRPSALEIAETYGTAECKANEELVKEWNSELRRDTGTHRSTEVVLKEKEEYKDTYRCRASGKVGQDSRGDPETAAPRWLVEGAPLGIEIPIETCRIFPPMDEQEKVYVSTWDSDSCLGERRQELCELRGGDQRCRD